MSGWPAPPGFRAYPDQLNMTERVLDRHVSDGHGAHAAILWDGGQWSYTELKDEVDRLAVGLIDLGISKNDKILVRSRNLPQTVAALLAALKIGAVPVWVNALLREEELAYILDNSEARTAYSMAELAAPLQSLRDRGLIDNIIVLDGLGEAAGEHGYETLKAPPGATPPEPNTAAMDPAFMCYSSGTTGRPKGIAHAHRWVITVGDPCLVQSEYNKEDIVLTPGEFSFMGTFAHSLFWPLYRGATIALYSARATPKDVLSAVERHRATVLMSVPTFYRTMLGAPEQAEGIDYSSLRYVISTGESLGAAVCEQWVAGFGVPLYEVYGVSEVEVLVGNGPAFSVRPGSIGKGLPGMQLALLDDELNEVPDGESGVLMINLADPGLYLGYYRDPERTAAQHLGDWYNTGDVMQRDADGYYWYLGRNDDLFKSRGYLLSPQEIENAMLRHPDVVEAAVIGQPDERMGNAVAAFVVVTAEALAGPELESTLIAHCQKLIAPYKVPKTITFLDMLPKSPVGKILRRTLRADSE